MNKTGAQVFPSKYYFLTGKKKHLTNGILKSPILTQFSRWNRKIGGQQRNLLDGLRIGRRLTVDPFDSLHQNVHEPLIGTGFQHLLDRLSGTAQRGEPLLDARNELVGGRSRLCVHFGLQREKN